MKGFVHFLFHILATCGILLFSVSCSSPAPQKPQDIFGYNLLLRRTINLESALDAPQKGNWGVVLKRGYFQQIANAGFTAIRIPIRFSAHASGEYPYTLDPHFMQLVEGAVQNTTSRHMVAILDFHSYPDLFASPATEEDRFIAIWKQVAEHFQKSPDEQVFFELLNEPNGGLNSQSWNDLLNRTVAVVRQSNPTRPIIIGPTNYNGYDQLDALVLPKDPNLIVTFHYYLPVEFTHQGASWIIGADAWLGKQWNASPEELDAISSVFNQVSVWAGQNHRPIFLGEFGVIEKAGQGSRVRWTTAVHQAAEARGFSWAYWVFSNSGFDVFDLQKNRWQIDMLHALIPRK